MREMGISVLALALFLLKVSADIPFHNVPNTETFVLEVFEGNAPAPTFPQGACGDQAAGRQCPTGLCCSNWGWCGTTPDYCLPENCQSQCVTPSPPPPPPSPPPPPPSPPPPPPPSPSPPPPSPPPPPPSPPPPPPPPLVQCTQAAGAQYAHTCPTGWCCTIFGCNKNTSSPDCLPSNIQSQSKDVASSSPMNRMRGIGSFLLNAI